MKNVLWFLVLPACIELDDDGDGLSILDGDCDDTDAGVTTQIEVFIDADGDGFGGTERQQAPCAALPANVAEVGGDCDDGDALANPGLSEECDDDGRDEDCNGAVDDDDDGVLPGRSFGVDADGDGFPETLTARCEANGEDEFPAGTTLDCDDTDPAVYPLAPEACGVDVDLDCDGVPATSVLVWRDRDRDGLGGGDPFDGCPSDGVVAVGGDCDDSTARVGAAPFLSWPDVDNDGAGFRDAPSQLINACSPPAGRAFNRVDCDDGDFSIQFVNIWFEDHDGDRYGDPDTMQARCPYDDPYDPGFAPGAADCDDADPTVFLPQDLCENAGAFCGDAETSCGDQPTSVTTNGWNSLFGPWAQSLGDVDSDGLVDVAMGTIDFRRDWSGTGEPDQATFEDQARLLRTTAFDPSREDWDVVDTRFELPLSPQSNRGSTRTLLVPLDGDTDDELVILSSDRDRAAEASSLWVLDDPASFGPGVVPLDLTNAHRITVEVPSVGYPNQRTGYYLSSGDLDGDGLAEILVTSPTFSYDEDFLYVVPGASALTVDSTDDGAVHALYDDGYFLDGLGIHMDVTDLDPGPGVTSRVAMATLGSRSDSPSVVVLDGGDLLRNGPIQDSMVSWFSGNTWPPFSHERSARVHWVDMDGDGVEDDLLFAVTDSFRAHLYLFEELEDQDGLLGAPIAETVSQAWDLPFPDCTEITTVGSRVWVSCGDANPSYRTDQDVGVVLTFDLRDRPARLDADTTDQVTVRRPYIALGNSGMSTFTQGGESFVVFDDFSGGGPEGFSWIPAP